MKITPTWFYFALIFLGFWLLFAPSSFGYASDIPMRVSDQLSGIILIFFGSLARKPKAYLPVILLVLTGLWLELAPLIFWAQCPASYLNDTLIGVCVLVCSIVLPGRLGIKDKKESLLPPGWTYNPSSWPQRLPIFVLAVLGWFASRYLAMYQLGYIDQVWDPFFKEGTLKVITSNISKAFPISDAGLGAFAYTLEAILVCKGSEARWQRMPWLVLSFGFLVIPVGLTSITLILLQPLVVGAWCGLCLLIAFAMLIMIALSVDEVEAVFKLLKHTPKKDRWQVFWKGKKNYGRPCKSLPLEVSFYPLLKEGFRGCKLTFSLFMCLCIGSLLMASPSFLRLAEHQKDACHVLGAFSSVFALMATAHVLKKVQKGISLLGILVLIFSFFPIQKGYSTPILVIFALLLITLPFKRSR